DGSHHGEARQGPGAAGRRPAARQRRLVHCQTQARPRPRARRRRPGTITGPSERPSRQPRENRKAKQAQTTDRGNSTYRQERAGLVMLYAAKIAAARLYAPEHELDAIL